MKFFRTGSTEDERNISTIPKKGSDQAAGFDLCSTEDFVLYSGKRHLFTTGIGCELSEGMVGIIMGRSKLAYKFGIQVLGGVIDSDYRGEIRVILTNLGDDPLEVNMGDAIAQLVPLAHYGGTALVVDNPTETARGTKGVTCEDMRVKKM